MERSGRGAPPDGNTVVGDGAIHPGWQAGCRAPSGDRGHPDEGRAAIGGGGQPRVGAGGAVAAKDGATGTTPGVVVHPVGWGDDGAVAAAVGRRIRLARGVMGISQATLAARLGCARPTISRWERGRRAPSLAALVRLAAVLGVAPAALLPSVGEEG